MVDKVSSLQRIDEWNPCQITKCKHETKSIAGDVHRGQDGAFLISCKIKPIIVKRGVFVTVLTHDLYVLPCEERPIHKCPGTRSRISWMGYNTARSKTRRVGKERVRK